VANEPPVLKLTAIMTAKSYSFRGEHGVWAICTVNDGTGELLILSDWGSWSHRWNIAHLGKPTLTEFIADVSGVDYLSDKLHYGRTREVFDPEASVAALRARLLERQEVTSREDLSPLDQEAWDELAALETEVSREMFSDHLPASTFDRITSEPWEWYVHKEPAASRILRTAILPALIAALQPPAAPAQAQEGASRG
jgi:hypothetical protein